MLGKELAGFPEGCECCFLFQVLVKEVRSMRKDSLSCTFITCAHCFVL